jgi:hypothetical protein
MHFFLWLLSKNKLLTCDNLEKRMSLVFGLCGGQQSLEHSLPYLSVDTGTDYESVARLWLCNKKHGITSYMLEPLETKEFYDLPRRCLDRHETAMTKSCADAQMLESTDTNYNASWLRKCHFFIGEDDDEAGDDEFSSLVGD